MSNRRSTNTYADDGEHLDSDDLATEGMLAIAYYNVGIMNKDILGRRWTKPSGKRETQDRYRRNISASSWNASFADL